MREINFIDLKGLSCQSKMSSYDSYYKLRFSSPTNNDLICPALRLNESNFILRTACFEHYTPALSFGQSAQLARYQSENYDSVQFFQPLNDNTESPLTVISIDLSSVKNNTCPKVDNSNFENDLPISVFYSKIIDTTVNIEETTALCKYPIM